jgi:hypothetical protein
MITLTWTPISIFKLSQQDVVAPWLMAQEDLGAATTYLKLKAKGNWTAMAGLPPCGPDGLIGQSFSDDRLLVTDCSVGALIGRIGGSSASLKSATTVADSGEGKPFPIGVHALLKLPEKFVGPLYLGFNILLRPMKLESLEVEILGGS